ncbi:MAG TPA: DNA cytosine methyltransferase [Hyphomicrobiaceae bacterium]|nr:DNA cytosine methyltransferase [Hyphomicrobiaceae bacterium]
MKPKPARLHLDLFSGIGGFAIAAQNCGYTTVAFCEKEPYAQQILKERFSAVMADANEQRRPVGGPVEPDAEKSFEWRNNPSRSGTNGRGKPVTKTHVAILHPDIFTLNGTDYAGVDLLTGGFPCQPFSVAGKRRGASDDRALWPEMLRVIDQSKPAWVLGENVAGIVTMELDNILSDLEDIGYAAWPLVIPACAVDARHRRDRVWIVGNSVSLWKSQSQGCQLDQWRRIGNASRGIVEDVAHAENDHGRSGVGTTQAGTRQDEQRRRGLASGGDFRTWPDESDWFPQSPICRVAHGIPHRAHRLRALGNAIVPQVAEEIIRAIP